MRRKDREMNEEFGLNLVDKCSYGIISMSESEHGCYSLPLSIVRDDKYLYFHGAKEGKKAELLEHGKDVTVVFVGEAKVPDNFSKSELEEMATDVSKGVQFISKVFTTEFESVIIRGKTRAIEEREEKIKALRLICEKYTPDKMKYFDIAIKSGLDKTNIYSISIDELTSKRKKYDMNNEEMKWGRMD